MSPAHPAAPPSDALPRLARWLLSVTSPPHERAFLLDDLAEEFSHRASEVGRFRANAWLLSQTARSLGPLALTRIRSALRNDPARLDDVPSGDPMLTQLRDDLRYSLRGAIRRPWLSLTIVATMTLGIGATTAVFSIIDALLLEPLPFPAPEQLVRIWSPLPEVPGGMAVNHDDFADLKRETRSIASLALYDFTGLTIEAAGEPERVGVVQAGRDFGETLQLRPVLGRLFAPDEYLPNGPAAIILSHAFWTSHFPGDTAVVGRSMLVNGRPRTVVGVLPPSAAAYPPGDLGAWVPLVIPDDSYLRGRYSMQLNAVARLRPGVTIERSSVELEALARRLARDYPTTNTGRALVAAPLRDTVVGPVRPMLVLLGTAVAAVLLIACANLGSLLLAHSQSRVREFAVRAAIGGASGRIARQLMVESLLLAAVGGASGIWLSRTLVKGLVAVYPTRLPRVEEIGIDWRVIAVALGTTALAGLLAALPLARRVGRLDLVRDLRVSERGLGSRTRRRLLDGLVVGQVATSVALLFAAGVLLRTFADMTAIRPGFDTRDIFTFNLAIPQARYPTPERQTQFYDALFDSLRAVPGVRSVGWSMFAPFAGGRWGDSFVREGTADAAPNLPSMQVRMVSPEYATTLGIPLRAGRSLARTDRANSPGVALVNSALAAAYYPGTNPVGKRITFQKRSIEIVGVLADSRTMSLWSPPEPEVYVPIEQWGWRGGTVFVRTASNAAAIEPRVRAIVRSLDRTVPVVGARLLEERVRRSMAPERFRAVLIGALAALALLLAVLGIYGLVASVVGQRTREIGIRMALGASRGAVLQMILGRGLLLAAVGVAAGLVVAAATVRLFTALLFGVSVVNVPTYAASGLLLLAVGVVASYAPARRAMRVDPVVALRTE
jgi:putative ABC transport system permease protein